MQICIMVSSARICAGNQVANLPLEANERAENELRKDFTVNERVEIGKALEAELLKRNGVRHDTATARENFPEVL